MVLPVGMWLDIRLEQHDLMLLVRREVFVVESQKIYNDLTAFLTEMIKLLSKNK